MDLTTDQLAARWGVSPATIRGHRHRGTGPLYISQSRMASPRGTPLILYPLRHVLAFEEAHGITPIQPA